MKTRDFNGKEPITESAPVLGDSSEYGLSARKIDAFSQLLKEKVITTDEYVDIINTLWSKGRRSELMIHFLNCNR